jgi:hypothetical protein
MMVQNKEIRVDTRNYRISGCSFIVLLFENQSTLH